MCTSVDLASKAKDGKQPHQIYDAAHGTYKPLAPQLTGGTAKGGPSPFKGAK